MKARGDLRVAELLLSADPPFPDHSAFHIQQTAEKAMKGFLAFHDHRFRKTHNLAELGNSCTKIDATLSDLLGKVECLTEYSWQYRYPGEAEEPTIDELREAIASVEAAYNALLSRLPSEAHP